MRQFCAERALTLFYLVEMNGIEPSTSCLPDKRQEIVSDCTCVTCEDSANPVAPTVAPEFKIDRKQALLETLRSLGRDELLELLAEALTGRKP